MSFSKSSLLVFILLGMTFHSQAQFINTSLPVGHEKHFKVFSSILLNGKSLVQDDTPDGNLSLAPGIRGTLSISTIDRSAGKRTPMESVQFKVAIRDWRQNTMWMYSDETYEEIDFGLLSRECEMGDVIILIPIDRTIQLPRHEIVVGDGC